MMLPLAVLGLVAQVAAVSAKGPAPIRVWLPDTTYTAETRAGVYVQLRDAGYVTVLHVDPVGRIHVLFPLMPDWSAAVPGGATLEVGALVNADGGVGTILAARSRWPFQATGLITESAWDYDNAMLLQPTAGDPLAALLDIADRMADGRPYDTDVTTYTVGGRLAARDPELVTPVYLGCVRSRTVEPQSSVAINHSNTVDCAGAVLLNSFCGVVDNRVTNTSVYHEVATVSEPVYVPYYVPVFIPRRTRAAPSPAAPPRNLANVIAMHRVRGVVVPSQPRRRPVTRVQQPRQRYAPIEPRRRDEPGARPTPSASVPRAVTATVPVRATPVVRRYPVRVSAGALVAASPSPKPAVTSAPQPAARALPMTRTRARVLSSEMLRAIKRGPR